MVQDHWSVGSEPQFVTTWSYSWTQGHGGDSTVGRGWRRGSNRYGSGARASRSSDTRISVARWVGCETTRLQLGSTTTQAVAAFLFYPALVQCKANSGGRSRSQRAVLATSIRCLFSHHQRRRLTWPQRRCVTQRSNASTVPPNTRLLR